MSTINLSPVNIQLIEESCESLECIWIECLQLIGKINEVCLFIIDICDANIFFHMVGCFEMLHKDRAKST